MNGDSDDWIRTFARRRWGIRLQTLIPFAFAWISSWGIECIDIREHGEIWDAARQTRVQLGWLCLYSMVHLFQAQPILRTQCLIPQFRQIYPKELFVFERGPNWEFRIDPWQIAAGKKMWEMKPLFEDWAGAIVKSCVLRKSNQAASCNTAEAHNLAERFEKHGDCYLRFITTPGIEPTNNLAEQAIRFVVIDRKVTQGSRSPTGQRWLERIWTTMATCAQTDRSGFTFLQETLSAYCAEAPAPGLLADST